MRYNTDVIDSMPFAKDAPGMQLAEPVASTVTVAPVGDQAPSRVHLVACVAYQYRVSQAKAEEWLSAEFGA